MRISDWSSDVCSSDLLGELRLGGSRHLATLRRAALRALAARFAAAATGTGATAFTAAAEHLHLVAHDVGGVVLDAFLLVGAVLDPALDVDLAALAQVLAGDQIGRAHV